MKKIIWSLFVIASILVVTKSFAQEIRRSNPDDYKEPVMKAIAYGSTAPNAHNTQPWRIKIVSDTEFLLYAIHLLPETDPPSRQIHISLGCFIELVDIGMSAEGYKTVVEYLPEGTYELISDELASKPLAKITLVKTSDLPKDDLYDFINYRSSNRKPYTGEMIANEEFELVMKHLKNRSCELIFINDLQKMKPYLNIFSKAMEIETRTRNTSDETRKMFRFSDSERKTKRDGLNIYTSGLSGFIANIAEKQMKNGDSIFWHSEKMVKATMKSIDKAIYTAKGLVFFKTKSNDMLDWVACGRDFVRFNVALAKYGLALSHYNQVVQEYPEMQALQSEFEALSGSDDTQKIQIIVRVGRAKPTYQSWRKNIEDVILK